jgi:hypothetical protein
MPAEYTQNLGSRLSWLGTAGPAKAAWARSSYAFRLRVLHPSLLTNHLSPFAGAIGAIGTTGVPHSSSAAGLGRNFSVS